MSYDPSITNFDPEDGSSNKRRMLGGAAVLLVLIAGAFGFYKLQERDYSQGPSRISPSSTISRTQVESLRKISDREDKDGAEGLNQLIIKLSSSFHNLTLFGLLLAIFYRMISLFISSLLYGGLLHLTRKILKVGFNDFSITLKIALLLGVYSQVPLLFYYLMLSSIVFLNLFSIAVYLIYGFLLFILIYFIGWLYLFHFLFAKFHKTTLFDNIKIFFLSLLLFILASIPIGFILFAISMFLVVAFGGKGPFF